MPLFTTPPAMRRASP